MGHILKPLPPCGAFEHLNFFNLIHTALEFRLFATCPVVGENTKELFFQKNPPNILWNYKKNIYIIYRNLTRYLSINFQQYLINTSNESSWLVLCNNVQSKEKWLICILLICINYSKKIVISENSIYKCRPLFYASPFVYIELFFYVS